MLHTTSRADAAAELLASGMLTGAFASDLTLADTIVHDMEMTVRMTWPEVGRASRVLETLDREIRRAARAWQQAYVEAGSCHDATVFTAPERFGRHLSAYPSPSPTATAHLLMREARAKPLEMVLQPIGETFAVLAQWPVGAIAFALSAFGCPITIHRQVEGDWSGHLFAPPIDLPIQLNLEIPFARSGTFRSVARHVDEGGGSLGELEIMLHRHLDEGAQDRMVFRMAMPT